MLRILFTIFVVLHGLIHLMGFAKAYNLADISALTLDVSKTQGLLWLLTTVLFVIAGVSYFFKQDNWWMWGAAAVILSQVLIINDWKDARFGTIANVIIVIVALLF